MSDSIYRQAAIDIIKNGYGNITWVDRAMLIEELKDLPSAQTEPSIPLSWIEEHIEWLRSRNNEFANLAATHISVMMKKWRREQHETH